MNEAITVELQFFLISVLWGAMILLVYDILRIFRRLIPHNSLFLALEDLIFWVLASVFIFAMIYTMNNGTIRGFSVMGMGIGMLLYHFIFSELVVKWITKALLLLLSPIRYVLGRIKRVFRFIAAKIKKVKDSVLSRLKKSVKSVRIALNTKRRKRAEKRSKKIEKKAAKKALADSRKEHKKGRKQSDQSNSGNVSTGNASAGNTAVIRRPDRRASYGSVKGGRRT
jgi:spore cortex biosynthesis protein YabQ